jgi:hypothetical protein
MLLGPACMFVLIISFLDFSFIYSSMNIILEFYLFFAALVCWQQKRFV